MQFLRVMVHLALLVLKAQPDQLERQVSQQHNMKMETDTSAKTYLVECTRIKTMVGKTQTQWWQHLQDKDMMRKQQLKCDYTTHVDMIMGGNEKHNKRRKSKICTVLPSGGLDVIWHIQVLKWIKSRPLKEFTYSCYVFEACKNSK